jgi:hypothetical protein
MSMNREFAERGMRLIPQSIEYLFDGEPIGGGRYAKTEDKTEMELRQTAWRAVENRL